MTGETASREELRRIVAAQQATIAAQQEQIAALTRQVVAR
jgi:uncharacterized coiled-coil protein SlyX